MKKIRLVVVSSSIAAIACAFSLASAQIPDSFKGKFPAPKAKVSRWTYSADMNADIPLIILVNRTGGTLTNYTQLEIFVDDKLGVMSHGKGKLSNGQQRVIAPYIRSGGAVRMVYKIDKQRPRSWRSKGPLQAGVPMVLTFLSKGKVTVNKPYERI